MPPTLEPLRAEVLRLSPANRAKLLDRLDGQPGWEPNAEGCLGPTGRSARAQSWPMATTGVPLDGHHGLRPVSLDEADPSQGALHQDILEAAWPPHRDEDFGPPQAMHAVSRAPPKLPILFDRGPSRPGLRAEPAARARAGWAPVVREGLWGKTVGLSGLQGRRDCDFDWGWRCAWMYRQRHVGSHFSDRNDASAIMSNLTSGCIESQEFQKRGVRGWPAGQTLAGRRTHSAISPKRSCVSSENLTEGPEI